MHTLNLNSTTEKTLYAKSSNQAFENLFINTFPSTTSTSLQLSEQLSPPLFCISDISSPMNPYAPSNSFKRSKQSQILTDRFIPNRKSSKLSLAFTSAHENNENLFKPNKENSKMASNTSSAAPDINKELAVEYNNSSLSIPQIYKSFILNQKPNFVNKGFNESPSAFVNHNLLRFQQQQQSILTPLITETSPSYLDFTNIDFSKSLFKLNRKIPKVPFKVLDAPALQDDFYLNLIDWNSENMLAVGLASCIYLWSAFTSKVTKLCDLGLNDSVTSVIWSNHSPLLSVGTNIGEVQIWDTVKLKKVRVLSGHTARVGAMAWSTNLLSSGSRDKTIYNRDIRAKEEIITKLSGHKQEVCGLKWSYDEQQLASGGNDNKLFVWNSYSNTPILKFPNHIAAVKAITWSPHQHGLLASGGGTADRTIRFWNTLQNKQIDYVDTGSQVCNLMFSKNVNELVSTHGYSMNQIVVWKYPEMEKITTLIGHTYRVLYLAMSPNGETIVTGAGDETLRFWNVFPGGNQSKGERKNEGGLNVGCCDLR